MIVGKIILYIHININYDPTSSKKSYLVTVGNTVHIGFGKSRRRECEWLWFNLIKLQYINFYKNAGIF